MYTPHIGIRKALAKGIISQAEADILTAFISRTEKDWRPEGYTSEMYHRALPV